MKTIYELGLHEITIVNEKWRVLRVPGGWIYERVIKKISDVDSEVIVVFVPLNTEYAPQS